MNFCGNVDYLNGQEEVWNLSKKNRRSLKTISPALAGFETLKRQIKKRVARKVPNDFIVEVRDIGPCQPIILVDQNGEEHKLEPKN